MYCENGAHIRTRTGDLFLTKEVLYLLSYVGLRRIWSGKRDSNPRPSAWKADALPTELHPLNEFSRVGIRMRIEVRPDLTQNPHSKIRNPLVQGAGFEPA